MLNRWWLRAFSPLGRVRPLLGAGLKPGTTHPSIQLYVRGPGAVSHRRERTSVAKSLASTIRRWSEVPAASRCKARNSSSFGTCPAATNARQRTRAASARNDTTCVRLAIDTAPAAFAAARLTPWPIQPGRSRPVEMEPFPRRMYVFHWRQERQGQQQPCNIQPDGERGRRDLSRGQRRWFSLLPVSNGDIHRLCRNPSISGRPRGSNLANDERSGERSGECSYERSYERSGSYPPTAFVNQRYRPLPRRWYFQY